MNNQQLNHAEYKLGKIKDKMNAFFIDYCNLSNIDLMAWFDSQMHVLYEQFNPEKMQYEEFVFCLLARQTQELEELTLEEQYIACQTSFKKFTKSKHYQIVKEEGTRRLYETIEAYLNQIETDNESLV